MFECVNLQFACDYNILILLSKKTEFVIVFHVQYLNDDYQNRFTFFFQFDWKFSRKAGVID